MFTLAFISQRVSSERDVWAPPPTPLQLTQWTLDEFCHGDRKFTQEKPRAVIALTFQRETGSGVVLARRGAHHPRYCSWQSSHHVATRSNNRETRVCFSDKVQDKRGVTPETLQNGSVVKLQSLAENWEKSPPTTGKRMLSCCDERAKKNKIGSSHDYRLVENESAGRRCDGRRTVGLRFFLGVVWVQSNVCRLLGSSLSGQLSCMS